MLRRLVSLAGLGQWIRGSRSRHRALRLRPDLELLERRSLLSVTTAIPDASSNDPEIGGLPEFTAVVGGEESESCFAFKGDMAADWPVADDSSWSSENDFQDETPFELAGWYDAELPGEDLWLFELEMNEQTGEPWWFVCSGEANPAGEDVPCDWGTCEDIVNDTLFWFTVTETEPTSGENGFLWEFSEDENEWVEDCGSFFPEVYWTFEDPDLFDFDNGDGIPRITAYHFRGDGNTAGELDDNEAEFSILPWLEDPEYAFVTFFDEMGDLKDHTGEYSSDLEEPTSAETDDLVKVPDLEFPEEMVWTFGWAGSETERGLPLEALMSSGFGPTSVAADAGIQPLEAWGAWQLTLLGRPVVRTQLLEDDDDSAII